jgi:hypothetical protein
MVDFADWAFTAFLVAIIAIAATLTLSQIYVQKGSSVAARRSVVPGQGGKSDVKESS